MDQICPILWDNWETELHTNPLPFQNSFGIAINVKISIETFSFFQGWATNRAIFREWYDEIRFHWFYMIALLILPQFSRNHATKLYFIYSFISDESNSSNTASILNYLDKHCICMILHPRQKIFPGKDYQAEKMRRKSKGPFICSSNLKIQWLAKTWI